MSTRYPKGLRYGMGCALALLSLTTTQAQTGLAMRIGQPEGLSLRVDGRLTFDAATYHLPGVSSLRYGTEELRMPASTQLSQARIGLVSGLGAWSGRIDADFSRARVSLCDMFVRYSYSPQGNISIGHLLDPISIAMNTASRHISSPIAPAVATLVQGSRHWGITWTQWAKHYWVSAALTAGGLESTNAPVNHRSEGYGISARAVWLPSPDPDRLLHIGIGTTVRSADRAVDPLGTMTLSAAPSVPVDGRRFLSTSITGVQRYEVLGLEAAFRSPKVFLQGEAIATRIDHDPQATPQTLRSGLFISPQAHQNYYGGYLEASYMLRGTQRKYLKGAADFNNVADELAPGGNLELQTRLSYLDLKSGGRSRDVLVALNWFPNPNVLLGLSYSYSYMDQGANAGGLISASSGSLGALSLHSLQLRTQFVF